LDGPLAITTDGNHVWIASSRSNSLTEVDAESGAFIRFIHGAQFGLSVVSAITSSGRDVWATNLGTSGPKGTTVSEIAAATGKVVKVLSGGQYHFDLSNSITFIGNRVWVANQGSNSMTELSAS
jgi:DNA-binding beta-propeller fold protein YncE